MVEVMGFDRPYYLAGKEVTHERIKELGSALLMDRKRFEAGLTDEGRKVTERIRADMGRRNVEGRLAPHTLHLR